MTNEIIKMCYF